jgi:urea carboxylase
LRFGRDATFAVGGAAMSVTVDDVSVPPWTAIAVSAGAVVRVGRCLGPGVRSTLGVRGGIDVPRYLGSRSTFTLGNFGGHDGRALREGDELAIGDDVDGPPGVLAAGVAPRLRSDWTIGVLDGPHGEPDFLAPGGVDALLRAAWHVHHNSARTGVRLVGPTPRWARPDGGDAGLHPSNIHDTGYAFGAVDLTGDMPIILGPDGPSLGGFVCPLVVAAAERWKLGQLGPGDRVRFVVWSPEDAARADEQRRDWLGRATTHVEPVARPPWNTPRVGVAASASTSPVLHRRAATPHETEVN